MKPKSSKAKGFNHLKLVKSSEMIALSLINLDESIQSRIGFDQQTLDEYIEAWNKGDKFPPVELYYDGSTYWIGDGFHRIKSRLKANIRSNKIEAIVHSGSKRDAILHSVGANAKHGLRRTNEDKRHAVEILLRDEEWSKWSNREIARKASVTEFLVRSIRKDICDSTANGATERLVERNGTIYSQKLKKTNTPPQSIPLREDTSTKEVEQKLEKFASRILELRHLINGLQEENLKKDETLENFQKMNNFLWNQNQALQQEIEVLKQKDRERQSWIALFNSPYVSFHASNSPIEIQVGDETFRLVRK